MHNDESPPILMRAARAVPALALALALGVVLAPPHAAPAVAAPTRTCPNESARIIEIPKISLSESDKPASDVGFVADVGSDGRVRDVQLLESSGDRALDARVRDALEHSTYRPTRSNCVAVSSAVPTMYRLTDATPGPAGPPTAPAAPRRSENCVPFVNAFVAPMRSDGGKRGTVTLAVDLDAAGSLRGARVQKGSGTPALDTEAVAAARAGSFTYVAGSPCARQSTTYFLEMTFE